MADLTNAIGEQTVNNRHDVALVQAMLSLVDSSNHMSYLGGFYDGIFGGKTSHAIKAFQTDYHTSVVKAGGGMSSTRLGMDHDCVTHPGQLRPPARINLPLNLDDPGKMNPGAATILKLNDLLPRDFKDIMIAPGTRVVYWPDLPGQAEAYAKTVKNDKTLDEDFRNDVGTLVRRMYEKHKILLTIAPDGGRRSFQRQYEIATDPQGATDAGPGESNHNWGRAVDIGFNQFEWLQSSGTSMIDDWWLNKLFKLHPDRMMDMWKIRNAIAFDEVGLFRSKKPGDHIHIQAYSDDSVSMVKSLAALLDKKGALGWRYHHGYETDLGFAGAWHKVGTAIEIWEGSGPMEKHWIATGKGVPVASITDSDVKKMRAGLRADFEAAEAAAADWEPVPS